MVICPGAATSSIFPNPAVEEAAAPWRGGRAVEGAALEMLFRGNSNEGSNPSLSANLSSSAPVVLPPTLVDPPVSMAARIGPPATTNCEPRQARKGAAAAVDSGAGARPVGVATLSKQSGSRRQMSGATLSNRRGAA